MWDRSVALRSARKFVSNAVTYYGEGWWILKLPCGSILAKPQHLADNNEVTVRAGRVGWRQRRLDHGVSWFRLVCVVQGIQPSEDTVLSGIFAFDPA